ncbi:MAG: TolC family protein, partial [Bradymonadaceae bacterium]
RQAYARRDLTQNQISIVQENLDSAVVETYYNLLTLRRVIDLSVQQVESSQTMLGATEARVRAGTVTDFELTRARLRLVQTEKDLERARLQFVQVRQALAQILQIAPDFDVTTPVAPGVPDEPEVLAEQARQNRATVQADFLNIIVAQRGLEEVYWRYMPAFSATFTYFGARETAFTPADPQWSLVFGAEWILWDGGMRRAEIQQNRAQLVAAEIRQRQTLHRLDSEIQSGWTEYLSAQAQVESGQSEVELAMRSFEQAEIAYRHGVATQLDVINAQDQLQLAQISFVQDQLLLELAAYNLRILAGVQD